MAKLNYSESGPLTSGKIGGQQIIKNRHGVILQSISQPPSFGTVEQKKQRFVTNTLAQKWKQLTALQKQSFADSATTWFKKSKTGQIINQSPYGLFLFLQQNSALIGEDGPLFGVDYASLVEPQAYLTNKTQFSIVVKSDNTVNDYEYLIFIDPRSTDFRVSQLNSELLVGRLTALELGNGVDVAPMIQSHYDFPVNMSKISIRISAVEMGTGRRSEDIRWLYQLPKMERIGTFSTAGTQVSHALASNGMFIMTRRQNTALREYETQTAFDINNLTRLTSVPNTPNGVFGMTFSQNGLHAYFQVQQIPQPYIRHYTLTVPFDFRTSTFTDNLIFTTDGLYRGIYIATDGTFIISTSFQGTSKYYLPTPYSLTGAVLIDFNQAYKSAGSKAYMFSNDGLTFFEYHNQHVTTYSLTTPFNIQEIGQNVIKTVNIESYITPSPTTNRYMSMSYNGLYFTISTYNSVVGRNDLFMFKLPTPFKLADF